VRLHTRRSAARLRRSFRQEQNGGTRIQHLPWHHSARYLGVHEPSATERRLLRAPPSGNTARVRTLVVVVTRAARWLLGRPALQIRRHLAREAQVQDRPDGRDFQVVPLSEQSTPRDLGTSGRAHPDLQLTLRAAVEAFDDRRPVSRFRHLKHSTFRRSVGLAQCRTVAHTICRSSCVGSRVWPNAHESAPTRMCDRASTGRAAQPPIR